MPDGIIEEEGKTQTFTQEQLDAIVKKRVKKMQDELQSANERLERLQELEAAQEEQSAKLAEAEEQAKSMKNELNAYKRKEAHAKDVKEVAEEYGVPANLLRGTKREELEEHAKELQSFAKDNSKVVVPGDGVTSKPEPDGDAEFAKQLFSKKH